jgi:sarcosine oxidase subunit beta
LSIAGDATPMSETADAIVVGGGLNGAATAFFLLGQGLRRVVILDAGLPGDGASGASVGLLRSHYDNRPEAQLAVRSLPYFRQWAERIGGDCGWRPTGFLRFVEPEELGRMERNVAFQRSLGERVEVLSPAAAEELFPAFTMDGVGAVVHEPDSGTASNSRATHALLERTAAAGASLRFCLPAERILVEAGRVAGIATRHGNISAPVVVLAAGLGCRAVAATCGVALPLTEKMIRVAAIMLPERLRGLPSYMDPLTDSWLTPRDQGAGLISVPPPPRPLPGADPDFDRAHAGAGLPAVAKRLPDLAAADVVRWWMRADCYAPDGKPIIGGVDALPGLFLNTAGAGKGHKVAPAAALGLSELIAGGAARTVDLGPFGLDRFSRPLQPWSDSEYGKRVIG